MSPYWGLLITHMRTSYLLCLKIVCPDIFQLPTHFVCVCALYRHFSSNLLIFFPFYRNLGKSGLRVSCLGLGKLGWRQGNIQLSFKLLNKIRLSVSPSLSLFRHLGDIWIADLWWSEHSLSVCLYEKSIPAHLHSFGFLCNTVRRTVNKSQCSRSQEYVWQALRLL